MDTDGLLEQGRALKAEPPDNMIRQNSVHARSSLRPKF